MKTKYKKNRCVNGRHSRKKCKLYAQLTNGAIEDRIKTIALTTLFVWAAGFGQDHRGSHIAMLAAHFLPFVEYMQVLPQIFCHLLPLGKPCYATLPILLCLDLVPVNSQWDYLL